MGAASSKKSRRAETAQKKDSARRNRLVLVAVLAGAALALGGWYGWREANRPGQFIESMGRAHVPNGTPSPAYNSAPPTSGPHAAPVGWGEHRTEIPHINQVHNLEHGGVLIQYNCEHDALRGNCDPVVQALRELLRFGREEIDTKVILAPYADMSEPIALTTWTRLQYLAAPDREAILRFVRSNINRAPEQVE